MAVFNKQNLLSELTDRTELVISNTQPFLRLTNEQLNEKVSQDAWSIAEVFEHLNKIHQIYIKDIVQKLTGLQILSKKQISIADGLATSFMKKLCHDLMVRSLSSGHPNSCIQAKIVWTAGTFWNVFYSIRIPSTT